MTAIFNTKFDCDADRNGQKVIITAVTDTRDGKRYTVKFTDGYVIENAYETELIFD